MKDKNATVGARVQVKNSCISDWARGLKGTIYYIADDGLYQRYPVGVQCDNGATYHFTAAELKRERT